MEKDKTDKGFELYYDKLSYRRKFIRTLWLIPIGIAVGILIAHISIIVSLIYWLWFIIAAVKQLKYTYTMWKKETDGQINTNCSDNQSITEEYTVQAKNIKTQEVRKLIINENCDENGNFVLSASLDGVECQGCDNSYFEAFKKLKDILLQMGYGLNCLGAKINAVQSEMASASDKIYLAELGKQAKESVSLYDYCENTDYPTKAEQDAYREKWFGSLKS